MESYSDEEIARLKARMEQSTGPWYHKIKLAEGLVTPGRNYDQLWSSTRAVMEQIDYSDKKVLDIGSWDGYWAFLAEKRGAATIVATDTRVEGSDNLLFAKHVLNSRVFPLFNAPVQDLVSRLRISGLVQEFDVVQHLGVLYHLRDPMLSLAQSRRVLREGGYLVLETAAIDDSSRSFMAFNGTGEDFSFYGPSDTWAPTTRCLEDMLVRSAFKPVMKQKWGFVPQQENTKGWMSSERFGRITLLAEAVSFGSLHKTDFQKEAGFQ